MKHVIYQSRKESERKQTAGGGEGVPEMDRRGVDELVDDTFAHKE